MHTTSNSEARYRSTDASSRGEIRFAPQIAPRPGPHHQSAAGTPTGAVHGAYSNFGAFPPPTGSTALATQHWHPPAIMQLPVAQRPEQIPNSTSLATLPLQFVSGDRVLDAIRDTDTTHGRIAQANQLQPSPTQQISASRPPPRTLQLQELGLQHDRIDIYDLLQSHSMLYRRFEQMKEEVECMRRALTSLGHCEVQSEPSRAYAPYALRRITMFACRSAVQTLLGPNKELSEVPPHLCAATSVRQVMHKSKAVDSSLFEFRAFARACYLNSDIDCAFYPSDYHVLHLLAVRTNQLQIVFPSYADFCTALDIDVPTRQAGLLRKQTDRRKAVRAIQVVGFDVVKQGDTTPERRIFPAISVPSNLEYASAHAHICLYQHNATWSDNSWESGFVRRMDAPPADFVREVQRVSPPAAASEITIAGSDFPVFSVVWKKHVHIPFRNGASDEYCIGSLRLTIPAVIIRGRLLTTTTQDAFKTPVDGKLLSSMLVSKSKS